MRITGLMFAITLIASCVDISEMRVFTAINSEEISEKKNNPRNLEQEDSNQVTNRLHIK